MFARCRAPDPLRPRLFGQRGRRHRSLVGRILAALALERRRTTGASTCRSSGRCRAPSRPSRSATSGPASFARRSSGRNWPRSVGSGRPACSREVSAFRAGSAITSDRSSLRRVAAWAESGDEATSQARPAGIADGVGLMVPRSHVACPSPPCRSPREQSPSGQAHDHGRALQARDRRVQAPGPDDHLHVRLARQLGGDSIAAGPSGRPTCSRSAARSDSRGASVRCPPRAVAHAPGVRSLPSTSGAFGCIRRSAPAVPGPFGAAHRRESPSATPRAVAHAPWGALAPFHVGRLRLHPPQRPGGSGPVRGGASARVTERHAEFGLSNRAGAALGPC